LTKSTEWLPNPFPNLRNKIQRELRLEIKLGKRARDTSFYINGVVRIWNGIDFM
jgi:hypothetical protein